MSFSEQHSRTSLRLADTLIIPVSPRRVHTGMPLISEQKINDTGKILQDQEILTEEQQAKDLNIKVRVRMAKMILRVVNFSCSLIVLAMVSVTLRIFLTTRQLPARNNLPAWATRTQIWPQYVVLTVSCISLAFCLLIFWSYWRGGHRRAESTAVYSTAFALGFFIFSIVTWGITAGILQSKKSSSGNHDIWGWSCLDNQRRRMFSEEINYALICKLQSWALVCCIIEVVVDTITVAIYGIVFYRYYSKRRLQKAMNTRDHARSEFYSIKYTPSGNYLDKANINVIPALQDHISATSPVGTTMQKLLPRYFKANLTRQTKKNEECSSAAIEEHIYDDVPIPQAYSSPAHQANKVSSPQLASLFRQ